MKSKATIEANKRYDENHREQILAKAREKSRRKTPKHRARDRERSQERRMMVICHYGGNPPKCLCCGESNIGFLTIDHLENDGHLEKTKGSSFAASLIRKRFPPGYQVLCFNCNCGRERNGGICPHHRIMGASENKKIHRAAKLEVKQREVLPLFTALGDE